MSDAIDKAILKGNLSELQRLLADADQATRTESLYTAATYGKEPALKLILELGADVNQLSSTGEPPVIAAARGGFPTIVQRLLAAKAVVDAPSSSEMTALAEALMSADSPNHLAVIDELLKAGANPYSTPSGDWMIAFAIGKRSVPGVVPRLLAAGVDPNELDQGVGATPLHLAIEAGCLAVIRELLEAGARPDVRAPASKFEYSELTPLEYARKLKNKKVIALLEESGTGPEKAAGPATGKARKAATAADVDWWQKVARRVAAAPKKPARHGQAAPRQLAPGASADDIAACEKAVGIKLTKEVADYFRTHNGQLGGEPGVPPLSSSQYGFRLLSLAEAADEWRVMFGLVEGDDFADLTPEPDEGIKPRWWNRRWLPFASNGGGDLPCLDFDPNRGGKKGQVVAFFHELPARERLGASLSEFFASLNDEE